MRKKTFEEEELETRSEAKAVFIFCLFEKFVKEKLPLFDVFIYNNISSNSNCKNNSNINNSFNIRNINLTGILTTIAKTTLMAPSTAAASLATATISAATEKAMQTTIEKRNISFNNHIIINNDYNVNGHSNINNRQLHLTRMSRWYPRLLSKVAA